MSTLEPKRFLDRDALLALADRVIEDLYIPEWKAWVHVGSWDGTTRWLVIQKWPGRTTAAQADLNLLAMIAAYSLVDAEGERLYDEDDIPALAKKNAKALDRIMARALAINGLAPDAVDALGKDSGSAANGVSTSNSPAISA